ncbi:MAG: hypothetical protein GY855_07070 [candidate division Zixibacteria bacterium]|nr:hypothetical protein [candidate division Zixibacteria bacterium]
MTSSKHRNIQFVSDALVQQIVEGRKTASVVNLGEVELKDGEYDDALVVGEYYDVYDSNLAVRTTIRIIAMELCRWDNIPERLWRGETNTSADEFRDDHLDYFENPDSDFEFVAYYFDLVG